MGKKNPYRSHDDHPYWETVKRLPTLQAKVEYTWENWRVHILGVAFVIVLIASVAISNYKTNIPTYLQGAYVNLLSSDTTTEAQTEYLNRVFLYDHLGIDEDQRLTMRCTTELPLDLEGGTVTSELTYNTVTRMDGMLPSNEFDYFFMTEDLVNWLYNRYGTPFLDLREFLTADELAQYADRLRYTRDGTPVGFDITDSTLLAQMSFTADKPVCFAWFAYVEKTENMRPFFDFLLTTLP